MFVKKPWLSLFCVVLFGGVGRSAAETLFDHHTFHDFSKGVFSDSGANLYVSEQGNLQFINRFDLNNDGYPEVVVNNDHNHYETPDVLIYLNDAQSGLRSLHHPIHSDAPAFQNLEWTLESLSRIIRLPAQGAGKSVLADLNGDGHADLLFTNFIHGWSPAEFPVFIYWGGKDGFDPANRSLLPADRGTGIAIADLNGDGLMDIVISNAGREYFANRTGSLPHHRLESLAGPREKRSYIFYQTEAGFTTESMEVLPTLFAIDVKTADIDQNGEDELIFLEAGKPGALRIFQRKDGAWRAMEPIPVLAPTWGKFLRGMWAGDLNGDGLPDIAVPSAGMQSEIFWNQHGRFSTENRSVIETGNAFGMTAGDLNKDGFTDLVVANYFSRDSEGVSHYGTVSHIWWGGKEGFRRENRMELPTSGATSAAIADINGDGLSDILFSQHRDEVSFDVPSVIYLNSKSGFSPMNRMDLQSFGAISILAADVNGDGSKDVLIFNRQSGQASATGLADATGGGADPEAGALPLYLFWGNAFRAYGPANLTPLPRAAAETGFVFADMDDNGQADLVYLRRYGKDHGVILTIHYDVAETDEPARIATLEMPFTARTLAVADFDKDGFLDIFAASSQGGKVGIWFGGRDQTYRPVYFDHAPVSSSCAVGDFNNDGILDVATAGKGVIAILPGKQDGGFHFGESTILSTDALTITVTAADFDHDGWLDLLCQNVRHIDTELATVDSWVLRNDQGHFSMKKRHSLKTFGAQASSVARLDSDEGLSTIIANYNGDFSRHVATFILKPDTDGFPDNRNPVRLPSYSSSGNIVLDFDGDGYQDILVFNHSESNRYSGELVPKAGKHGVGSAIYWGGEEGFTPGRTSWIPSFGPHNRSNGDPGSLARRNPYEAYTSPRLANTTAESDFVLTVAGRFNERQFVEVSLLKNGEQTAEPLRPVATSPDSISFHVTVPPGTPFRYSLKLCSSNSGNGPVVSSVRMESRKKSAQDSTL